MFCYWTDVNVPHGNELLCNQSKRIEFLSHASNVCHAKQFPVLLWTYTVWCLQVGFLENQYIPHQITFLFFGNIEMKISSYYLNNLHFLNRHENSDVSRSCKTSPLTLQNDCCKEKMAQMHSTLVGGKNRTGSKHIRGWANKHDYIHVWPGQTLEYASLVLKGLMPNKSQFCINFTFLHTKILFNSVSAKQK